MVQTTSQSARLAVMRASQLLRDKRYADALQVCTDELALGADDPQLRLVAAHSLLAQGRHEGAKKEAQQVLRLDPGQPEAHRILADVASGRGEVAVACEHLERVLDLEPGDTHTRALLGALSRAPAGANTGPTAALSAGDRASSIDRLLSAVLGGSPESSSDLFAVTDSMMEELPDEDDGGDSMLIEPVEEDELDPPARRGDSGSDAAPTKAAAGWMPGRPTDASAGAGKSYQRTSPLPSLDELDGLPEDDDAPTMPLLRPSAPREPDLRLDPLASKPVSHQRSARGDETPSAAQGERRAVPADRQAAAELRAYGSDLAGETGGDTQPVAPGQIVGDGDLASPGSAALEGDSDFEDFDIESASVPLPRGAAGSSVPSLEPAEPILSRPLGATGPMPAADDEGEPTKIASPKRPEPPTPPPASSPEPRDPAPQEPGLMGMLAGEVDEASVSEVQALSAPQGSRAVDSWDPLAEADSGVQPPPRAMLRRPHPADRSSTQSIERPGRRGRRRWIGALIALLLLAAGGAFGYYRYRTGQLIDARFRDVRAAMQLGTPAGAKRARSAAEKILERRSGHMGALAAIGMAEAAMAVEFGEDRLKQARAALERTKGTDSEWRTAAAGFLQLIESPDSAAGYLRKGIEVFPDSALLQYLRGRALAANDKLVASVEAFESALKLAPELVPASIRRAEAVGQRDFDQAVQLLDKVLERHPEHVQALLSRARLCSAHGKQIERATADLQRITGQLAQKAGQGQIGWAHLVLAKLARRKPAGFSQMTRAIDAAIASTPCCDARFFYELSGQLLDLYRSSEAREQMEAALRLGTPRAAYLQRMARVLLAMERPSKAASYIARAPAGQPATRLLRARLALMQGKAKEAVAQLEPLIRDGRVGYEARVFLALARARTGHAAAAARSLRLLAKKHRDDRIPQARGRIHLRQGEYAEAESALRAAWKLNSLDPRTPTLLGRVSLARHDYARARKRFLRALKTRSDYAPAQLGLAEQMLLVGDRAGARKRLEQVSAAERDRPLYHLLDARLSLSAGKLDEAEAAIARAREAGASAGQLARLRGELALERGQGKSAVHQLSVARKSNPKDADLLVLLGRAYRKMGKLDASYDTLHDALRHDAQHPVALLLLGRIAIYDMEYALAVKRLESALAAMKKRQRPDALKARAHTALGLAYLKQNDTGRALTNFQDAMSLDAKAAEPAYRMGTTYDKLDRPQRALSYYLKAIELDADYAPPYLAAGRAYAQTGDKAKAQTLLATYLKKAPRAKNAAEVRGELSKLR